MGVSAPRVCVFFGGFLPQGVCSKGLLPGGVCSWGVSAPGGVSAPRGCLLWGVSAPRGVSDPRECLLLGGGIPACTEADTPAVNRMTDRCKNITLATTSLRPVTTSFQDILFASETNVHFVETVVS